MYKYRFLKKLDFKILLSVFMFLPLIIYGQSFTRLTTGNIVNDDGASFSTSWGDYDNDGYQDLFVANSGQNNFLYHNNGDGTFTAVKLLNLVSDGGNSSCASWGDYDNDGFLDLFVGNYNQKNFLYRNNGNGTFTKITSGAIVDDIENTYGCSWGDYDNDRFLDMFVTNHAQNNSLYHNNGDGTFTKITEGEIVNDGGDSRGCAWGDYDNDSYLDLFVANYMQNNFLYHNNGDGTFTKITTGEIANDGGYSNSCNWIDFDNDGDFDLFVTNAYQPHFLYLNWGDGTFTRIKTDIIPNKLGYSYSSTWGDFDNDGDLDVYIVNAGENNFLYSNNGDGTFTQITTGEIVTNKTNSRGCSNADFDNDGDLDIFVANRKDENNLLYSNDGNSNSWINIKCVGTSSNVSAIGAKVKVKAAIDGDAIWQLRDISGQSGLAGQNSLNAEFGLGNASVIDSIIVEWPGGIVQVMTNVPVNQFLTVTEPMFLSIPIKSAVPNDMVRVPVNIHIPPNYSFSSAQIKIGGYFGRLEFVDVVTDSSLIGDAGWTYQANETDDTLKIWLAGTEEIAGKGVFFWLKFFVPDTERYFIRITLESALFDNDGIPVELKSGGVKILYPYYGDVDLNRKIQAFDAAMILKYLVGYVDLNDEQWLNADVSLDSTISALDATLILQYGVGLIDSLPYPDTGVRFASGNINMEDRVIQPGKTIEIPLILSNNENILSFEGRVVFNPQHLIFKKIIWSNAKFMVDVKHEGDKILIAGASTASTLENVGILGTLQFTLNDQFNGSQTKVTLQRLRWNESTTMENVATATLFMTTKVEENGTDLPQEYSLSQNYPNPFNPSTTIRYSLKESGSVKLFIYNEMGRLVRTLVHTTQSAGDHSVLWDGNDELGERVASGIYFYTLSAGDNILITRSMIMIK